MTRTMRRSLFWSMLCAVLVLTGYAILRKDITTSPDGVRTVRSDVLVYVKAASDMLAGKDIYTETEGPDPYVYPPFYAFLNIPLIPFDPLFIDIAWFILNVVLIGVILHQSYRLFTGSPFMRATRKEQWICAGLSMLFSIRYLIRNAHQGNINVVILFLVVCSRFMIEKTGKAYWSGLIGVAVAIKIFPVVFILYFAARKQWKCIAYLIAALLAATFLPSIITGLAGNWEYLRSFFSVIGRRMSPAGVLVENYSFWGTFGRLLSHQPAFLGGPDNPVYVNIMNLDLRLVQYIVYAVNGLLLMIWYVAGRIEAGGRRHSSVLPGESSIVLGLLTMHLAAILIEDHHVVTYLVAFMYLLIVWRRGGSRSPWFTSLLFFAGALPVLMNYDLIVPLFGRHAFMILIAWSLPTLAVGMILFSLVLYSILGNKPKALPVS